MKPKTKIQREVDRLFRNLPPLTARQEKWAYDTLFEHVARRQGNRCWCSECGHIFQMDGGELYDSLNLNTVECPCCGKKLDVKQSRKQKSKDSYYFTTLITWHGFQVVRHFVADSYERMGAKTARYIHEVVQIWINEQGQEAVAALPTNTMSRCYDAWRFGRGLEIRERTPHLYRPDKYDIFAPICPHGGVLAKIRRNGYSSRCQVMAPDKIFRAILTSNGAETLIKQGQFECLRFFYESDRGGRYEQFRPMINIATRHGYIIQDVGMWKDMLTMQEELGIDTRNPKNICPDNLPEAHDQVEKRYRVWWKKTGDKRKARIDKQREEMYRKEKGAFLGIEFSDGSIRAFVIPSVDELKKEGETMHHCVWSAKYDTRPECLILSVRDSSGKRLATVELNLDSMKIMQCRGMFNSRPQKYAEIRDLIRKNIGVIADAKKRKNV